MLSKSQLLFLLQISDIQVISYPQKIHPALSLPVNLFLILDWEYFNFVPFHLSYPTFLLLAQGVLAWQINNLSRWVQHLLGDSAHCLCFPCSVGNTFVLALQVPQIFRDYVYTNNDRTLFIHYYQSLLIVSYIYELFATCWELCKVLYVADLFNLPIVYQSYMPLPVLLLQMRKLRMGQVPLTCSRSHKQRVEDWGFLLCWP